MGLVFTETVSSCPAIERGSPLPLHLISLSLLSLSFHPRHREVYNLTRAGTSLARRASCRSSAGVPSGCGNVRIRHQSRLKNTKRGPRTVLEALNRAPQRCAFRLLSIKLHHRALTRIRHDRLSLSDSPPWTTSRRAAPPCRLRSRAWYMQCSMCSLEPRD